MKRFFLIGLALLAAACVEDYKSPWPDSLQLLSVNAVYPVGYAHAVHEGAVIRIEEVSSGAAYLAKTDRRGLAEIQVPPGIYRITCSDRTGKDLFNGAADKVVVTERRIVDLLLSHSTAGGLVVKEIYCSGCSKAPQEGTYQSDQYVLLHSNDFETVYLDSLCFGTLSPYNSTSVNNWTDRDPVTGETVFPDFVPVVTVVWQLPGSGKDFPLEPGADAVIALRGAIDHTLQYPLSVNLNRPDVFACYNPTYFSNPTYHPAPGDQVKPERYAQVVVKTGQSNANVFSISSPTVVLFRTPMIRPAARRGPDDAGQQRGPRGRGPLRVDRGRRRGVRRTLLQQRKADFAGRRCGIRHSERRLQGTYAAAEGGRESLRRKRIRGPHGHEQFKQ